MSLDLRDHKQLEMGLVTEIEKVRELSQRYLQPQLESHLAQALERLHSGRFTLAVVGEFKRGKSTLINALLGQDLFPTDVLPTTATLNRLVYSLEQSVELWFHDQTRQRISLEQLAAYTSKLDPEAAQRAASIRQAVVYFPCQYCRNHVELLDTPGLQDEQAMSEVTLKVISEVDAAILVISALSPLSESELDFLEQLSAGPCARIFVVISSIDRLQQPQQLERLVQGVQRRLDRLPAELRAHLHPQLFPLSAYQALQARQNQDAELLRSSRLPEFEGALEKFLAQERGRAALLAPLQLALQQALALMQHLRQLQLHCQQGQQDLEQQKPQSPLPSRPEPIRLQEWQRFLAQESAWKAPLRIQLEQIGLWLPQRLPPNRGLLDKLRAGSDLKARQELAQEIFQQLQAALEQGLKDYGQEMQWALDRQWDDVLDLVSAPSPAEARSGLARNQEWAEQWQEAHRQQLKLRFEGRFASWPQRPLAPPEVRRELEIELILQLGQDLSQLQDEWYGKIEAVLRPPPAQAEDSSESLRRWIRRSVLLEKEAAELQSDQEQINAIVQRWRALAARLGELALAADSGCD